MRYKGLNSRQSRFVDEYIFDLNGTKAAIRAGYSKDSAQPTSSDLLSNPMVARAVQMAQDRRAKRTDLKADRIVLEEKSLAFSDLGEIFDFSGEAVRMKPANEIPEQARRAIQSIKIKKTVDKDGVEYETTELKLWPKDPAQARLRAHLGMPTSRMELTGKGGKSLGEDLNDGLEQTRNFVLAALSAIGDDRPASPDTSSPDLRSEVQPPV